MIDDSIPIAGLYRAYNNIIELLLSKQAEAEMMTRINFISMSCDSFSSPPPGSRSRHGEEMKILQTRNVPLKQTTINKRQKGNKQGRIYVPQVELR